MPSRASFAADFGPDAVQPTHRQRREARADIVFGDDREAVGLVELGRDLRDQLVGREADRAVQAGGVAHGLLQFATDVARAPPGFGMRFDRVDVGPEPGRDHVREVDVDLVDAAVLDLRRERAHRRLEEPRILPVLVEVDRQQDRVGRLRGGLHHAHGRVDAQRARLVGRGRDHAPARVVGEAREAALLRAGDGIGHPDRLVP